MKFNYSVSIAAAIIASAALVQGATFFDNFSTLTPGTPGTSLNTYNGWTQSEPNPLDGPLAWGQTVGSSNGFGLGAGFAAPVNSSFTASHSLSTSLAGTTLFTTFTIVDSEAGPFQARNNYSIGIFSGLTSLFTLNLNAQNQDTPIPGSNTALWTASVPGATPSAFSSAANDSLLNLTVNFVQNLLNVDYSVSLQPAGGGPAFTTSGTVVGGAAQTIDRFSVSSSIGSGAGWGNGFIGVDNVSVVPEPSTLLLLGLASCGLIRRRRN